MLSKATTLLEQGIDDVCRRPMAVPIDDLHQAVSYKELSCSIGGLEKAICGKHKHASRLKRDRSRLEVTLGQKSQDKAG